MANATFNSGIDHFGLVSGTSNALKVVSSSENRSKQSASGANSYDDPAVVDSWGETADPFVSLDFCRGPEGTSHGASDR